MSAERLKKDICIEGVSKVSLVRYMNDEQLNERYELVCETLDSVEGAISSAAVVSSDKDSLKEIAESLSKEKIDIEGEISRRRGED